MKVVFTLIATILIGIHSVSAVPAYPRPLKYTQSDGTQITIRIIGDEYRHYTLSSDGYTLAGGSDGDLYYATLGKNGNLIPTNVKARPLGRLTTAERSQVSKLVKGIKPTAINKMRSSRKPLQAPQMRADGKLAPPARISSAQTTGTLKSLVILVNYKDTKFNSSQSTANPQQAFQNMLMQDGYSVNGAMGSAWNYYQDNSNKQFNPQFDVVGPYTVSKNSSYYAGSDGTAYASTMIVEAAKLADADVNYTDYADNGVIRNIFVFFAGENQAEGGPKSTVWPHQWNLSEDYLYNSVYLDGQHLDGYACSSEINYMGVMAGIGTFCHEFGHVLGWPDFYDTDYEDNGESPALETFSLMCSGSYNNEGRTPPAVNIMERWMMGWAEPEDISTTGGTFLLDPVWQDKGYLVRTPTTNDYFLLENRAAGSFKWDNYIEDGNGSVSSDAKGLLVYHVDYTSPSKWSNNILNAYSNRECMKLVRSVPGSSSAGSPLKTYFPGNKNVTTLSSTSNKDYKSWKNESPLLSFTSISLSGEQVKLVSPFTGDFSVTASQFQAQVSWSNPNSAEWQITWSILGGEQIGTKKVNTNTLLIEGLTPGTTYKIALKSGSTELSGTFSTEPSPAKMFEVEVGQNNALISWENPTSASWTIGWATESGKDIGTETIKTNVFLLEDLTPGQRYKITLKSDTGEYSVFFTTASLSAGKSARINIPVTGFTSGKPILLSILDFKSEIDSIEWTVDGEQVTESYLTLTAGEHKVKAAITAADGTKTYIIKYITVE